MDRKTLLRIRKKYFDNLEYQFKFWRDYNYDILNQITYARKQGRGENASYNECFIMADTETSKKESEFTTDNHICAWTISIRTFENNVVTLWGIRPSEMILCFEKIHSVMLGSETYIYFHNLAYDWIFIRKFMFERFGYPNAQLNTKSHYPINIKFDNGIILKDSLILAQRSLEKWANDLNVEHKKAVGFWDYDIKRNQNTFRPNEEELHYIENDTLSGVECLDSLKKQLKKNYSTMPFTATGIPREEIRKRGFENNAKDRFLNKVLTFEQQIIAEKVYHGGYTHANRWLIGELIKEKVIPKDFASSYPFTILSEKFPQENFTELENCGIDTILKYKDKYAFMFKFIALNVDIKNNVPMPVLQYSKCEKILNPVIDNGRILKCDYVEIWLCEIDLQLIYEQYNIERHLCTNVLKSKKDFLPRWLTDYVFELFEEKTKLKGGDKVLYNIAKAKLNSIYGCFVQKPVKETLIEDYESGIYDIKPSEPEEEYLKYVNKRNSILNYQWGVWVTAYAMRNLFELGKCIDYENGGEWIYSDTDSIYATKWNEPEVEKYNNLCKNKLQSNNYGCVFHNNREYWLGIAEEEDSYIEYKTLGAKRYAGRLEGSNQLKITIAGVPKKTGVKCLDNDMNNFRKGTIFLGSITGKLTHTYNYVEKIYVDDKGNETGDSIDLTECDYLLDQTEIMTIEELMTEYIELASYREDIDIN